MYESTALVAVPGQGTDLLAELFATLVNVYSLVDSTVNLTYPQGPVSRFATTPRARPRFFCLQLIKKKTFS